MKFIEWLSEMDNCSSRSDQVYDDFTEVKDLAKLRKWLEAAYIAGHKEGSEITLEKSNKALNLYERERSRFRHNNPELTGEFFLSGGYGDKNTNMLPKFVEICPAYGCAWTQVYEITDKIISSEGS